MNNDEIGSPAKFVPTSNMGEKWIDNLKNLIKKPVFWIVIAAVVVAIVVIIVLVNINKPSQAESTENNTSADTSNTGEKKKKKSTSTDTMVRELIEDINTTAKKYLDKNDSTVKLEQVYDQAFPVYQPESSVVPISLSKSYGLRSSGEIDEVLLSNLKKEVEKFLKKRDYSPYHKVELAEGITQFVNFDDGLICISDMVSVPFSINCGSTSWITNEAIALAASLAEAYKAVEGEYPVLLEADISNLKNSPFEPYQKLIVGMGDVMGLFYRSSPTADWVYFTSSQDMLNCSDYEKDTGARRAFQGETCYDTIKKVERKVTNGS